MIRTLNQWHMVELARGKCTIQRLGKYLAVYVGSDVDTALIGKNRFDRNGAQTLGSLVAASDASGKGDALRFCVCQCRQRELVGSAFDDSAMKKSRRRGRCQVREDAESTSGLAKDSYVVRVPTEGGNVPAHPLQRKLLVLDPIVARDMVGGFRTQYRMGEEPQGAEAIVDGNDNHAAFLYQLSRNEYLGVEGLAGIGAESVRFYAGTPSCDIYGNCTNYVSSTHFMGDLGGGIRFYPYGNFFVRPEVRLYLVHNNVEFSSGRTVRYGLSIGYTFGGSR